MWLSCFLSTLLVLADLLFVASADSSPKQFDHGVDIPTTRPLNMAHRGSSGVYPEHSLGAYQQAIQDGADFIIECDVTLTKDLQLICSHDNYLSTTTDVASRRGFAGRNFTREGRNDWWAVDFTLAELKTLRRRQKYDFREQSHNDEYTILTLDEHIDIARGADRTVGIYPEPKKPEILNTLPILAGQRFEDLLLEVLHRRGYGSPTDPCFVQCFNEESLRYMSNKTSLPLIICTSVDVSDETIKEWGTFLYGVGAWKQQFARLWKDDGSRYKNWISEQTDFVQVAHDAGLKVHAATFRNEDKFLAWDFNQDPLQELEYFFQLEIDGFITDFPKTLDRYLDTVYAETCPSAASAVSAGMLVFLLTVNAITEVIMILQ